MGPQNYAPDNPKLFDEKTHSMTPKQRTDMVEQSLKVAKDNKLTAAGLLQNQGSFASLMNSHGLFAYNTYSDINFSITMRTEDSRDPGTLPGILRISMIWIRLNLPR